MKSRPRVRWADLPAELLAIISDHLKEGDDIRRFRSICRSWRSSAPNPPLNKLSTAFPCRAVFLIRPRNPNSKKPASAWIVSVQEPEAGKLLLRHALNHQPIPDFRSPEPLDLSGWSLTRIATSSGSGGHRNLVLRRAKHVVKFNGCIYAVDTNADVYVIDLDHVGGSKRPKLIRGKVIPIDYVGAKGIRFVVSDADLYLVVIKRSYCCEVYKLVVKDDTSYSLEKAKDLGKRVFFITKDSSFAVSARDLPPPLIGNCVVFDKGTFANADSCIFSEICVWHLGAKGKAVKAMDRALASVYSALFTPPRLRLLALESRSYSI